VQILPRSVGDRQREVDVTADRNFTELKVGFAARIVFELLSIPRLFPVSSVVRLSAAPQNTLAAFG
jgi:hypothetical protein